MGKRTTISLTKTILVWIALVVLPNLVYSFENSCPLLKLTNGRIRYRFRMKNARFNCMRGYQLVGAKYTSCMNGKWDAPAPICVRYGCRAPSTTRVNGQFIESYRGAVVKIVCNPGYSLEGSPSVYCNGAQWNETFPVCSVFNKNPALSCDFESDDLCGWSHDPMQDFDWKRINLKNPPSGEIGGPGFDHTVGLNNSGVYMFLGSFQPRMENETTRLFSPVYPPEISNGSCFKFWYFMPEGNMDTLKVFVKPEGVELYDIIPSFWLSGDQGRTWIQGFFHIYPMETRFQIVIEGIKGAYYTSDTAFDDVKIAFGDECLIAEDTTIADVSTTGDQFEDQENNEYLLSCRNRCNQVSFVSSTSPLPQMPREEEENDGKCDCHERCTQAKTCCLDYFDLCQFSVLSTVELKSVSFTSTISASSMSSFDESEIKVSTSASPPSSSLSPSTPPSPPLPPPLLPSPPSSPPLQPSPSNDFNKQNNEIDPRKPFPASPKIRLSEKPLNKSEGSETAVTKVNKTVITIPPINVKVEKVTVKGLPWTPLLKNTTATEKKESKSNVSVVFTPVYKPVVYRPQSPKYNTVKFRPKWNVVQTNGSSVAFKSNAGPGKKEAVSNTTLKTMTNKTKNNETKTTVSPWKPLKMDKNNSSLWKKVKIQQTLKDDNYHTIKTKEFSGKEPPQAIKIDANDDNGKTVVRKVLEIGGICSALLVVTGILGALFYRRSRNRKLERDNMVEDSDVRYLTSDEVLDFTLAHPADDDL